MVAVVGSIAAELLLDRSKFDQGLGRAGITAKKFEGDTRASLGRVDRSFTSTFARVGSGGAAAFASMAKGAALALAPILSVTAALNTTKAALTDFDRIGKAAKTAGIDAEFFQGLEQSAMLGGVGVDQLSQALAAFNRNAGMAAIGKGELVEKLKQLNPELLKNIIAATDQEQRIRLVADALDKETDASRKAAIAAAAFGDAGVKMVEMLKGGAAALDDTARKARELGIIVDRDLIARAETLNDELSVATKVMDLQFKQALIDLAPILISTAQLAGNLASAINYMTESMQALGQRSRARLEQDLAGIDDTLAKANATMGAGYVGTMGVQMDPDTMANMQAERDAIYAELKRRAVDELAINLSRPTLTDDTSTGTGTSGRNAAADAAIKQAESVKSLIANLQHEQEQLGRSAEAQEYFNLLKKAGVTADSDYGQAIAATLGPLQAQRAAIEANQAAMEQFQSLASDTLKSFVSDLREGKSFTEALTDSFGRLADRLLDMALDNAISSLFGNLFGAGGGCFGSNSQTLEIAA